MPYVLSLNEAPSLEVGLQSNHTFSLSLNRVTEHRIIIYVQVKSKQDLIEFDQPEEVHSTTYADTCDPPTCVNVTYEPNTSGDKLVRFRTKHNPGHVEVICQANRNLPQNFTINDSNAYLSIDIHRYWSLTYLSITIGWIYFFAWSISFYFQIMLNYKRKSVVGLNFDFIALNLLGFASYTTYNATMLFSSGVRDTYYKSHAYTRIPVEYNDLFFSAHALLMSVITAIQCFIYERGQQGVSKTAMSIIGLLSGVGIYQLTLCLLNKITIYDFVYYLSTVKLIVTLIKYTPQAFMNFKRKATTGWSIHNILLDFTGGIFSLGQLLVISYNYNDWVAIFGNISKTGLAILSICFDLLFMVQHYILYKGDCIIEDSVDQLNPVISESIRSVSYIPQQQQPPTPGARNGSRFSLDQSDSNGSQEDSNSKQQDQHQAKYSALDEGFDNRNFDDNE